MALYISHRLSCFLKIGIDHWKILSVDTKSPNFCRIKTHIFLMPVIDLTMSFFKKKYIYILILWSTPPSTSLMDLFPSVGTLYSPYGRAYVVIKMVLNKSANNAGFTNSSVLQTGGQTSVTARKKQSYYEPNWLCNCVVTSSSHQRVSLIKPNHSATNAWFDNKKTS